ncbi:MAG TPA: porin family protein [Allosphingosinicella sp.]|jgi:outer membrane immunogenic protein|nr:porin family protein [Allosphingosinicella sp.]
MKTTLYALASVAALAAAATPAAAEGFRAEIHGGWDHAKADDTGPNDSDSGIVYGIGAGYDFKIAPKVELGIDLSADLSTMEECETGVLLPNDKACLDAGRDLAAAIRLGYKVGDRGTLYALAGYTNARFRFDYTTPAGVTTRDGRNLDGFRLGAGYQHGFGEKMYGKVEYRYSNYEADVTRHQVLLGVGVNF